MESLGVWWCCACSVAFVKDRKGPCSWFPYYPYCACECRPSLVREVAQPELLFTHLAEALPAECNQKHGFVDMLFQTWFSLPSPASMRSGTSPFCGSRCIWGTEDDSRLVEWTLYRPFSMPFLFSLHTHRNTAIITVMIYSPPGGRSAPFHSDSCMRVPPSLCTRSQHDERDCSRLPRWQRTGQTRASDAPPFRGITAELRAPTERRNESAQPVIVTSLTNKPGPGPASELFKNLPHFSKKKIQPCFSVFVVCFF